MKLLEKQSKTVSSKQTLTMEDKLSESSLFAIQFASLGPLNLNFRVLTVVSGCPKIQELYGTTLTVSTCLQSSSKRSIESYPVSGLGKPVE